MTETKKQDGRKNNGAKKKKKSEKVSGITFYTKTTNIILVGGMKNARMIAKEAIEKQVNQSI